MSPEEKRQIPNAPSSWLVATSPHVRSPETVSQIMWTVVLALLPACVAGLVVFGWRAGTVLALGTLGAMLSEAIIQRVLRRRVTVSDGSAAVTGLLLAMCLPPNAKWYVPLVGSFVAVFVGKQVFGGLGRNYFNPALIGRAFLQFAFPAQLSMPKWPVVFRSSILEQLVGGVFRMGGADAVSLATPLAATKPPMIEALSPLDAVGSALKIGGTPPLDGGQKLDVARDLLLGNIPGCIGEISKLALLLGGLILILNGYVNWRLPLAYILSAVLAAVLLPLRAKTGTGELVWAGLWAGQFGFAAEQAVVHLLAGGLFLGAFFMITDMVTRPATSRGQVIYGVAAGVLVALIRDYGGYPEGVCYSILLVNAARLLVEKITVPRVFGTGKGAARA